jgi:hypothetical protein
MTEAIRPELTGYGNSFGKSPGNLVTDTIPNTQIDRDKLGKVDAAESTEFTDFENGIKNYVLGRLGHPVIKVELADFNIKQAIHSAITKLSYHAPRWNTQMMAFKSVYGVNLYELPKYILDNLEYVGYKKNFLSVQSQAGTLEFDFFIKYFQENFLFSDFSMGDFYLLQSHLEMTRRILGNDGSWDVIDGKYLQLYPSPQYGGEEVIVIFRGLNTETIHPAYLNWIDRYALAVSRETLGQIRGKYKTVPSPAGGAQLNGGELVQQAQAEMEKLERELVDEIEEPPYISWG